MATFNDVAFKNTFEGMEEITYADLVTKRNNSQLIPGKSYRITDYVTTATQSDTQSANHAFDVIVIADANNKLNENAHAIQHSGDMYFYGQKLESWEIKYCIDNDANRFAWADTTNGKGVIYYMKDEYDNECGYDFKNIQMKYYKITATTTKAAGLVDTYSASRQVGVSTGSLEPPNCTVDSSDYEWRYTFDLFLNNAHKDYSLNKYSSDIKYCHGNKINSSYDKKGTSSSTTNKQRFINIISFRNDGTTSICHGNTFGYANFNFSFGDDCYINNFGSNCYSNSFGSNCYSNSFGSNCKFNTFSNYCNHNIFGNNCDSNSFDANCGSNIFGIGCDSNNFSTMCNANIFGDNCHDNTFGFNCNYNTCGNSCFSNNFGNFALYNSFGNNCYSNTFVFSTPNPIESNSFGNECIGIEVVNGPLIFNIFGNGCKNLTVNGNNSSNLIMPGYTGSIAADISNKIIPLLMN